MDKSELFSFVKSDSIKNFIKASEVKTNEDIEILQKSGYMIGFTFDKLAEVFPKEIADRLYYNNGFDKTFYFDKENMILFSVNLYGKEALMPFDKLIERIYDKAAYLTENVKQGDYSPIFITLNDKMRMEMLNLFIEDKRSEAGYKLFKSFYPSSDYGCSELSEKAINNLCAMKSAKEKAETERFISDFPDKVKLYRGEGDRSSDWRNAMSWTTDINIANFFASRMLGNSARILVAEADKKNIIEYFDNEKECLVRSKNIRLKDKIELKGIEFLGDIYPKVKDKYFEYRDIMLDELDFYLDDGEHGKLHTLRVMLNALMIAKQRGLSETNIDKLCTAAIFHDTMRTHNGSDENHGRASAKYYRKFTENNISEIKYSDTVKRLIEYHCLPDEIGKNAISKADWELYDILKDADGLDRIRFGIRELDINQLRTPEAKMMTMVALANIENLKIPQTEIEEGMQFT